MKLLVFLLLPILALMPKQRNMDFYQSKRRAEDESDRLKALLNEFDKLMQAKDHTKARQLLAENRAMFNRGYCGHV